MCLTEAAIAARDLTSPVANLVDFLPVLQKLPTAIERRARQLNTDILAHARRLFVDVEARLQRGEPIPDCLAKTLILIREEEGLDEEDVLMMCAGLLIGGVESVRGTVPHAMKRTDDRDTDCEHAAMVRRACVWTT